jgi:septal ring factor EnvC (AmiA/AmiB activator)
MKILKLLPFFILFIGQSLYSQETNNSIENQFVDVIEKSNRYEDFKVVKITKLNNLKKSVSDSITNLKSEIVSLQNNQSALQNRIDSLSVELAKINEALVTSKKKEDGISFFGSIINKSIYNTILWGIIALLLLSVFVFIFKFKRSNTLTKEAQEKLTDTEAEYDAHRQTALEREQQLRRKLQDEINKQKKA